MLMGWKEGRREGRKERENGGGGVLVKVGGATVTIGPCM
jgi:hypothetical protein